MSTNDHTGARLVSKPLTKEYEKGWDRIFGNKENHVCGPEMTATEVKERINNYHSKSEMKRVETQRKAQTWPEPIADVYNQNNDPI